MESAWEDKVKIVRRHFEQKGYRVHSGLQFGCELVLYADDPQKVHSDFCISVVADGGMLDWREIQTLARSMADFHKVLILANVKEGPDGDFIIEEIALTTEHAPFRHKQKQLGDVGLQRKKFKKSKDDAS